MQVSNIPTLFSYAWGYSASGSYIRTIPQTTGSANDASLQYGFPPNTFVDPASGGSPPNGKDFNGILNEITLWLQWLNGGGVVFYNSAWSTANGGYPKWATLANAATPGLFWISTVDNNTSNPDTGGANWSQFPPTAAANVASFNTRTGAVTLTSADVTSALSANAVPFGKVALVAAQSVLGNTGGSPATAAPVSVADLVGLIGIGGNLAASGHLYLPVNVSGSIVTLIVNWQTTPAKSENDGVQTGTYDASYGTGCFGIVSATLNAGHSITANVGFQTINPNVSSSTFTWFTQSYDSTAAAVAASHFIIAIGI